MVFIDPLIILFFLVLGLLIGFYQMLDFKIL